MNDNSDHQIWSQSSQDPHHGISLADEDFAALFGVGDFNLPPYDIGEDNSTQQTIEGSGLSSDGGFNSHHNGGRHLSTSSGPNLYTNRNAASMDMENGVAHQHQSNHHPVTQQAGGVYGGLIPPTPSSIELQGGTQNLTHYLNQVYLDHYQSNRDDQMVFTPLISPAVGPIETSVTHLPEFAMPGAHMSPLTSPALEAHHMPRSREHSFSDSASPIDPRETFTSNQRSSAAGVSSSGSTSRSKATGRSVSRVVRQSPSMKPQRKKPPPPLLTTPELADFAFVETQTSASKTPSHSGPMSDLLRTAISSGASSSADSVSPEPLTDALMPPPPARKSRTSSSHSLEQLKKKTSGDLAEKRKSQNGGAPATPASLMNIANSIRNRNTTDDIHMGEATLVDDPDDSRSEEQQHTPTEFRKSDEEQQTPKLSSIKRKSSSTDLNQPLQSPSLPNSSGSRREIKPAHSRRGSTTASPALLPRLSPSIKPLLPQGSPTSAFLLTSKSNYENIVSGHHSQLGLSYPEHLSSALTQKKTSHKIAEKGRRNRINSALAEIAALLPSNFGSAIQTAEDEAESSSTSTAAANSAGVSGNSKSPPGTPQVTTSKANTVEQAIIYIKLLQTELADTQKKLGAAETELSELKAKKD